MIILGIDPGSRITGYGLIRAEGNRLVHLDNGGIRTDTAVDFPGRLGLIFTEITRIVEKYAPDAVAVENIFYSNNAQSALKLGQARGAAVVACVVQGIPLYEYSALQVKQAVVGHGKAAKEQVQHMVKVLLNLAKPAQADASDALAVAICHANSISLAKKLKINGQLTRDN